MGSIGNNATHSSLRAACVSPVLPDHQEVIQGLADALMEGLRLYEPASAGLWAETARTALNAAKPFLDPKLPEWLPPKP